MEQLLIRLKKYTYDTGKTYKSIAIECDIPFSTFYGFTGGSRNLKLRYADSLRQFLEKQGY